MIPEWKLYKPEEINGRIFFSSSLPSFFIGKYNTDRRAWIFGATLHPHCVYFIVYAVLVEALVDMDPPSSPRGSLYHVYVLSPSGEYLLVSIPGTGESFSMKQLARKIL